jgi:hypothetical protein
MTRKCAWEGCDADEYIKRLCETHLYPWAFERYIHGAVPTGRRVRTDGYAELEIDGLWAMEHRLILSKELGRQLRHDEVIVHLDGDRSNNVRDNLWLTNKSGAMKYRRDHPVQRELSKRMFKTWVELTIASDVDTDVEAITAAIEEALTHRDVVGFVTNGSVRITRATVKRGRANFRSN